MDGKERKEVKCAFPDWINRSNLRDNIYIRSVCCTVKALCLKHHLCIFNSSKFHICTCSVRHVCLQPWANKAHAESLTKKMSTERQAETVEHANIFSNGTVFFFSPRRVFLSQSRPILISCQSPTLLIKSKLLFLFVASNLCEHTRIYHQSAVAALKVKITAEFFFFSFFFLSWISCLIFIDGGFHLKSVSQSNSWRVESFSNLGHPADTLKRSQHLMYSVTLSR